MSWTQSQFFCSKALCYSYLFSYLFALCHPIHGLGIWVVDLPSCVTQVILSLWIQIENGLFMVYMMLARERLVNSLEPYLWRRGGPRGHPQDVCPPLGIRRPAIQNQCCDLSLRELITCFPGRWAITQIGTLNPLKASLLCDWAPKQQIATACIPKMAHSLTELCWARHLTSLRPNILM